MLDLNANAKAITRLLWMIYDRELGRQRIAACINAYGHECYAQGKNDSAVKDSGSVAGLSGSEPTQKAEAVSAT